MYATDVLSKILLPCEAGARATLAICERAEEALLGSTVHLVYFALVTQKSTAVGEALELLASFDETLVGSVMFVHMFTPFTFSVKCESRAFLVLANHLCVLVARWLLGALV